MTPELRQGREFNIQLRGGTISLCYLLKIPTFRDIRCSIFIFSQANYLSEIIERKYLAIR